MGQGVSQAPGWVSPRTVRDRHRDQRIILRTNDMKTKNDLPKAGDRIRIKLNFSRATHPCTVLAITEPDKGGRLSYTVEVDGGGAINGSCHKIATPFYPI